MDERVRSTVIDYEGINRIRTDVERYPGSIARVDGNSQKRNPDEEDISRPLQVVIPPRILLPVNIARCPLEVFSFINKFAGDHRATVILLHVVNLNAMVPDNRVFDALSRMAGHQLNRLAERFLDPNLTVRPRVRVGKPDDEILAEARESNVDLIVLSRHGGCSLWKRPFQPRIVEKVLRATTCNATLLHVRTLFNCEDDWACTESRSRV